MNLVLFSGTLTYHLWSISLNHLHTLARLSWWSSVWRYQRAHWTLADICSTASLPLPHTSVYHCALYVWIASYTTSAWTSTHSPPRGHPGCLSARKI